MAPELCFSCEKLPQKYIDGLCEHCNLIANTRNPDINPISRGCPCIYTTPCNPECTCTKVTSSHGCARCCNYGGWKQREQQAKYLASLVAPPEPMIGGTDIVMSCSPEAAKHAVRQIALKHWPNAIYEAGGFSAPLHLVGTIALPNEFFVHKNKDTRLEWEQNGRTNSNADAMLHIIIEGNSTTFVVDGPITTALALKIRQTCEGVR